MSVKSISRSRVILLAAGLVLLALCLSGTAGAKGYVFISYYDSNMQVIDAANYSFVRTFWTDNHTLFTASHDGRWLFLAGGHDIWGINTTADPGSSLQKTIHYGNPVETIRDIVVDDNNRIYLAEVSRHVEAYDGNSGERSGRSIFMTANPYRLALSPDQERLYVAGCLAGGILGPYEIPDYNISVYNADTFDHIRTRRIDMAVTDIAVSPDGSSLYVLGHNASTGSKKTKLLKLRSSDLTTQLTSYGSGSSPVDVVVSPDGDRVYVCDMDTKSILIFDGNTLALERSVSVGDLPRHMDISRDGKKLYITSDSHEFRVMDTDTYDVTHVPIGSTGNPADVEYVNVGPAILQWSGISFVTPTPGPTIMMAFNMTNGSTTPAPPSASSSATASAGPAPAAAAASPGPSPGAATLPPGTGSPTPPPGAGPETSSAATVSPVIAATPGFSGLAAAMGVLLAFRMLPGRRRDNR